MVKVQMKGKMSYLQVANVLINYALLKRFTRKLGQESKTINIAFSVKTATKTITITCTVSFVNRFTPTIMKIKMMISG